MRRAAKRNSKKRCGPFLPPDRIASLDEPMSSTTRLPIAPPEPFYVLDQQFAIDFPGARAVFTTRRGGVSHGPYESLNLGRLTDDEPEAVRRNRELLESQLGVELGFMRQVHG